MEVAEVVAGVVGILTCQAAAEVVEVVGVGVEVEVEVEARLHLQQPRTQAGLEAFDHV